MRMERFVADERCRYLRTFLCVIQYPQNQMKTKRPEPCAVQDSDRSDRLILILSNFWGALHTGAPLFLSHFAKFPDGAYFFSF